MRNRYKKCKFYPKVAEGISRNFLRLKVLCYQERQGYFDGRGFDDIFQDTVLYVIQDITATECRNDTELTEHFIYRYRMIEFQTIQDSRQLKTMHYADYLQTQTPTNEE